MKVVLTETCALLKLCYKAQVFLFFIWQISKNPYLCIVFFIVLDLRLTKVGVQRYSFFFALSVHFFFFTGKRKNGTQKEKLPAPVPVLKKAQVPGAKRTRCAQTAFCSGNLIFFLHALPLNAGLHYYQN